MWTYTWRIVIKFIFMYELQNSLNCYFYFMCDFLHVCMCIVWVSGTVRAQNMTSKPLELEFQKFVNCHVCSWNYIWDLWKKGTNLQTPNIRYPGHRTATLYPWGAIRESQLLVVNEAEARGFEAEQGLMIMNSCRSALSLHCHTTAFTPRVIFFLFCFVSLFHLFFVFSFKFVLI